MSHRPLDTQEYISQFLISFPSLLPHTRDCSLMWWKIPLSFWPVKLETSDLVPRAYQNRMHAVSFTSLVFLHPLSSPITAAVSHTLAIPLLGSHALPLLSQSLGCGVLNSVRHVTLHELYCKGNLFCLPLLYTLGWLLAGVPNIWDLMPDDLRWS